MIRSRNNHEIKDYSGFTYIGAMQMNKTRWGKLLIPLFGALFVANTLAEEPVADKSLYSGAGLFVIPFALDPPAKCQTPNIKQCAVVLGNMAKGQKLLLLGVDGLNVCQSFTVGSYKSGSEEESESDRVPITEIDISACPQFKFDVAVKGLAPKEYKKFALPTLQQPAPALAAEIDKKIRSEIPRLALLSAPEHELAVSAESPKVYRLPNLSNGVYLATYENSATPGDQAHFFYSNGNVRLIHAAASIRSIFSLDNEYFIYYSFTCRIGCGWGGKFIYKFLDSDFQKVLFDDSTSS